MRSIHQSPFSPLHAQAFQPLMMGFWMAMVLGRDTGLWGLACLLIALALGAWFMSRYRFGHGPFAKLVQVHRVVPWFFPSAVITHPLDGEPDLRDTLLDHGIGIAEIDGTRISTWTDLARELEAAYGPTRYPSEARAKCSHILLAAQGKAPRPKVLIWRHAAQTLRINPALVVEFTTYWTSTCISSWSPFLLLMDMPSAEELQIERPSQPILRGKDRDDEEPAMADLAAAPSDSWWKPKPGEMTQ